MRKTFRLEDIEDIVDLFFVELQQKQKNGPAILLFSGNLGAGKTTFIQTLAKKLGVQEPVLSPTFTMMRTYVLSSGEFQKLYHFDLYRVEDEKELARIGWDTAMTDMDGIVCVEWPEKAGSKIPEKAYDVLLEYADGEDVRTVVFE